MKTEIFDLAGKKGWHETLNGDYSEDEFEYLDLYLLQKWLREKKELDLTIDACGDTCGNINGYFYIIITKGYNKDNIESDSYPTYEIALEEALLKALVLIN